MRFQELRKVGELYAINSHDANSDLGPWLLGSDLADSDTAYRLKARSYVCTDLPRTAS
jgi:hypothetical protein